MTHCHWTTVLGFETLLPSQSQRTTLLEISARLERKLNHTSLSLLRWQLS